MLGSLFAAWANANYMHCFLPKAIVSPEIAAVWLNLDVICSSKSHCSLGSRCQVRTTALLALTGAPVLPFCVSSFF